MKYNTKSASVLEEADRFEVQMNWMLFTAEQDARIWAPQVDGEWYPGDPLHRNPSDVHRERVDYLYRTRDLPESARDVEYEESYVRPQYVRPMIEEHDILVFSQVSVPHDDRIGFGLRCVDCETDLDGTDPICFICGAYDYPIGPERPIEIKKISHSLEEYVDILEEYVDIDVEMTERSFIWRELSQNVVRPMGPAEIAFWRRTLNSNT